MDQINRRDFTKASAAVLGGMLTGQQLALAEDCAAKVKLRATTADALTIRISDPVIVASALPIAFLSANYNVAVEGYAEQDLPSIKKVTAKDDGLDITVNSKDKRDGSKDVSNGGFRIPRMPSYPGKRTLKLVVEHENEEGEDVEIPVSHDFLALPRRFKLDLSAATLSSAGGGTNCDKCGHLERVHFLTLNTDLGPVINASTPAAPQARVWTANIQPRACKRRVIRLNVTASAADQGTAELLILPHATSPASHAMIRFVPTESPWRYKFPIVMKPEGGTGAGKGCKDWPAEISLEPA